jgi:phage terminase small subunit
MPRTKTITPKESRAVQYFIENGGNKTKALEQAGYAKSTALRKANVVFDQIHVRNLVNQMRVAADKKALATFEEKVGMLWRAAQEMIPEDQPLEVDKVRVGVTLVNELNKMQGDLAAEKRMNVNINTDTQLVKLRELVTEYESEF